MKTFLYRFLQLTWGFPQSLLGLIYLMKYGKGRKQFSFHGAHVSGWSHDGGISLGMFIFIGDKLMNEGEPCAYLTHEYGHTIQSLLYGPLYIFVVGVPSSIWAAKYDKKMLERDISYFSVFPENQANRFGTAVTGIEVPRHIPRSLFED